MKGKVKGKEDKKREIIREELDRVIRKLKEGKPAGGDHVVNKV